MTRAQFASAMDAVPDAADRSAYRASSGTCPVCDDVYGVVMEIYDAWNVDEERHAL
jgi:hypothetical protein